MPDELTKYRTRLLQWYQRHQRDLPWRNTTDPYKIWVSEIMLQQTTVQTVLSYYDRFLTQFPHVKALAQSTEESVLKAWEGLGYYRRARSLHRGAQQIVSQGGKLPGSLEEWQQIPGIGRYTAGAIYSFSLNKPAPIVEANTQRLHARLLALNEELTKSSSQKLLWDNADRWINCQSPREINYALMELGSQVCKPLQPDCESCPLIDLCQAKQLGLEQTIPLQTKKQQITQVVEWSIVIKHHGKFLLRKRDQTERWAGMWDFFREDEPAAQADRFSHLATAHTKSKLHQNLLFPLEPCNSLEIKSLEAQLHKHLGTRIRLEKIITIITHHVTRYKITLVSLLAKPVSSKATFNNLDPAKFKWVTNSEIKELPLSVSARAIARLLED